MSPASPPDSEETIFARALALPAENRSVYLDEEIFELLRQSNVALCIADTEKLAAPTVVTADYGYLRLRREDYTEDVVTRWAKFVMEQEANWRDAFVYFKHEDSAAGPKFAKQMRATVKD